MNHLLQKAAATGRENGSRKMAPWVMMVMIALLAAMLPPDAARAGVGDDTGQRIGRYSPATAERLIAGRADAVARALRDRDLARFSRYVHPTKGVRFSPYVFVEPEHQRLSRTQIQNLYRDRSLRTWGHYDGSGEPIRLLWRDYYKQFVGNGDYPNAPQVFYDTLHHRGNTTNNLARFYPNSIFVEYYIPASEPGGLDWKSLWQVWQRRNGVWYLVGIAGNRWTI